MKKLEEGQIWRCVLRCSCGRRRGVERRRITAICVGWVDWDVDAGEGTHVDWDEKISMRTKNFRRWIIRTGAKLES